MMASGVGTNARKDLGVVAIDESDSAFGVELYKFLYIGGVDTSMIAAGLPSLACVVTKLFFLDPYLRFWDKGQCRPNDPSARD